MSIVNLNSLPAGNADGEDYAVIVKDGELYRVPLSQLDPQTAGTWNASKTYLEGVFCMWRGNLYCSLQSGNTNHEPQISPEWWKLYKTNVNLSGYTVNGAEADESGNFNITPELIGAAAVQHTHEITDVSGVEETLAGKADSVHTHPAVASISVNGGTPLTQAVTLKGGTHVSITQSGNLLTFNQSLPPFSNAEAIHTSNGAVPYKLFIGTPEEWSAFVKAEGENYLVIII